MRGFQASASAAWTHSGKSYAIGLRIRAFCHSAAEAFASGPGAAIDPSPPLGPASPGPSRATESSHDAHAGAPHARARAAIAATNRAGDELARAMNTPRPSIGGQPNRASDVEGTVEREPSKSGPRSSEGGNA